MNGVEKSSKEQTAVATAGAGLGVPTALTAMAKEEERITEIRRHEEPSRSKQF